MQTDAGWHVSGKSIIARNSPADSIGEALLNSNWHWHTGNIDITGTGQTTRTARVYMAKAERALAGAVSDLNEFMEGQLLEFRGAVDAAGIGLLRAAPSL